MNRIALHFALAVGWCITLASAPALADLYRCTGPNGDIVFTDDLSTCPGATKHEPAGAVQQVETKSAPPAAARTAAQRAAPAASAGDQEALKRHWLEKKRAKEEELRALEEKTDYLSRYVTGCNRGADVITRDRTGMKRTVPCDEIRSEYERALNQQDALRDYLADGLRRECRKAGCLPGWIR
jgi:hypothetical protein